MKVVIAYDLDGERRFALYGGGELWVHQGVGRRAELEAGDWRRDGSPPPRRVVDLTTGRAIGALAARVPILLVDAAWSWWEDESAGCRRLAGTCEPRALYQPVR